MRKHSPAPRMSPRERERFSLAHLALFCHRANTERKGEQTVMRREGIIAVLSMLLVAFAASAALAQNEHFVRADATLNANGSLTANFKEAGLGTNQLIDYTLTADAT